MGSQNPRTQARTKRKKRIRKKVYGTSERPRLSVFRSTKHIYAQVIDDTCGCTMAAASSAEKAIRENPVDSTEDKKGKMATAAAIGKIVAERAIQKGVKQVVFDRNGFLYHGRIKALSDGAREAGLGF